MTYETFKQPIAWYEKRAALNQIFTSGLGFAFLSKANAQVTPFVLCRDYLQDAIQGYVNGTKRVIYGFRYDPSEDHPVCITKTRLLVANSSDADLEQKISAIADFLHQIEINLKIPLTKVRKCKSPPKKFAKCGVWLFEGSARWMKSPPMISLYTLLIRAGANHSIGKPFSETITGIATGKIPAYQPRDREWLTEAKNGIEKILEKGDRSIFARKTKDNFPPAIDISSMHNNCGIVGFSRGYTKKFFPKWHAAVKV